ncbi:MAG TPA: putative quinol monooxygenase [Solirubrobacterales bacterium]|nr:putative quinol monooxygenase [Solirubrobacterales bacterium]HNA43848.1 putative quinol monooxygenase [Solirubrobacterales bacterium]
MSEVVVVAVLEVKEGRAEEAITAFTPVIEATHREPGCVSYALHQDNSDPNTLVLVERWKSQDDLNSHFTQPHMAEMGSLAADLLAGQPRIVFCSGIPKGDPGKGVL